MTLCLVFTKLWCKFTINHVNVELIIVVRQIENNEKYTLLCYLFKMTLLNKTPRKHVAKCFPLFCVKYAKTLENKLRIAVGYNLISIIALSLLSVCCFVLE